MEIKTDNALLGAAHLNTFLGFGRMSKLLLRSPFVGVS